MLNAMNYVDRLLFGVTQELIKEDLGLSDFQLGLLGGPAFALLYIIAAFPIARIAERGNRVTIITAAFATWSAMTALCGLAGNFLQMLIGRAGVSIGEAGCAPPSHSLISDYFPPAKRTTAMSIYGAAGPVGALTAAIAGGWFAQHYGWRSTFLVCGFVGIMAALLFRLTMREPVRKSVTSRPTFLATIHLLMSKRSFLAVAASGAVAGFASYSNHQYMVSFLMRAHDLQVGSAAAVLGFATGGIGIFITLITGPLIEGGRSRFPGIRTWLPSLGLIWSGCAFCAAFMVQDMALAIGLLLAASFGQHFYMPAMYTLAQDVAPPTMRATAAALLIALISLVGYGLGPPVIGLLSDIFAQIAMVTHGTTVSECAAASSAACSEASADGLRLSLSLGSICFIVAGLLFWLSGRTIEKDMHVEV
ncbi:MAG: MFS transporter [Hirschia sp.]|nr:MFS transporter [Hirschia sp.]MBF17395.1 MFS transporter [Hirschia sp.]